MLHPTAATTSLWVSSSSDVEITLAPTVMVSTMMSPNSTSARVSPGSRWRWIADLAVISPIGQNGQYERDATQSPKPAGRQTKLSRGRTKLYFVLFWNPTPALHGCQ